MGTIPRLLRVGFADVPGLPDLEVDLGSITALIGPRGSGKSQFLAAIAWLLRGRPSIAFRPPSAAGPSRPPRVRGTLQVDGSRRVIERRLGHRLRQIGREPVPRAPAPGPRLEVPSCSLLRARDRLAPELHPDGVVARALSRTVGRATSDAVAAEALVSVVEACCEECVAGEALLIEEPELQLTPQAQRYLYSLLRRFAEAGNQVLYSTRSAAFVDAARHDEIVRLDLAPAGTVLRRTEPATLSDHDRVRLAAEFDHERSEMFFARTVVLVEGQTERIALPLVFRALGHEPDAEGIAIAEVGGKSNIPLAAQLLRQLGIPFVVVFDADRGPASRALDERIRQAAAGAPVVRLDPDFEAVTGLSTHDDKVFQAWRRFAAGEAPRIPAALRRIVEATVALGR